MSEKSDFRHWGASEFPNDNPLLHDGAIWVCFAPCGPLRPVVRPRAGARSSTIPAPPLQTVSPSEQPVTFAPELTRPPPIEAPTEPSEALPSVSPPELESMPTAAAEAVEGGRDVDSAGDAPPSGCSLSAGLAPDESPRSDPRISEMRERFSNEGDKPEVANDDSGEAPTPSAEANGQAMPGLDDGAEPASPFLLSPLDVECSPKPSQDEAIASAAAEQSERMTILPPPSEDDAARTVTLTKIRVSGRSPDATSAAPPPADVRIAEAPSPTEGRIDLADGPSPEQDPFAAFVAALVDVALTGGATRAAAVLPGLLDGNATDLSAFPDAVRSSVVSAAIVSEIGGTLAPSASFAATSNAWRMVLRGESNDFSACGTSTLDGWAADLLKAFGIGRDGKIDVRRELRRRGVAAFGMILAA